MTTIWNWLRAAIATIGAGLGYFLGACDGFLYALIAFVVMDYITGIMCAIVDKKLSSAIGFKGIFRKVLIFVMVGIGHTLDMQILGGGDTLRTAVIFFYCANEGLSILENSGHLGLPIPEKLKKVLEQLHKGISGSSMYKRPQFLIMMQDAREGKFDVIYTKSVSRLSISVVILPRLRLLRQVHILFHRSYWKPGQKQWKSQRPARSFFHIERGRCSVYGVLR